MFGDAFSPYLIGALADSFKPLISPGNSTIVPDPVTTDPGVTETGTDIGTFLGSSPFGSQHIGSSPEDYDLEFRSLEYSLFTCCFFQVKIGKSYIVRIAKYFLKTKKTKPQTTKKLKQSPMT